MAIKEGLRLGLEMDSGNFGVESDCLNALEAASSLPDGCHNWDGILWEVLALVNSPSFLGFSFVRRGANKLSHSLAKVTHDVGVNAFGIGVLPLAARSILQSELPILH